MLTGNVVMFDDWGIVLTAGKSWRCGMRLTCLVICMWYVTTSDVEYVVVVVVVVAVVVIVTAWFVPVLYCHCHHCWYIYIYFVIVAMITSCCVFCFSFCAHIMLLQGCTTHDSWQCDAVEKCVFIYGKGRNWLVLDFAKFAKNVWVWKFLELLKDLGGRDKQMMLYWWPVRIDIPRNSDADTQLEVLLCKTFWKLHSRWTTLSALCRLKEKICQCCSRLQGFVPYSLEAASVVSSHSPLWN